jgi:hypothetical protein
MQSKISGFKLSWPATQPDTTPTPPPQQRTGFQTPGTPFFSPFSNHSYGTGTPSYTSPFASPFASPNFKSPFASPFGTTQVSPPLCCTSGLFYLLLLVVFVHARVCMNSGSIVFCGFRGFRNANFDATTESSKVTKRKGAKRTTTNTTTPTTH